MAGSAVPKANKLDEFKCNERIRRNLILPIRILLALDIPSWFFQYISRILVNPPLWLVRFLRGGSMTRNRCRMSRVFFNTSFLKAMMMMRRRRLLQKRSECAFFVVALAPSIRVQRLWQVASLRGSNDWTLRNHHRNKCREDLI